MALINKTTNKCNNNVTSSPNCCDKVDAGIRKYSRRIPSYNDVTASLNNDDVGDMKPTPDIEKIAEAMLRYQQKIFMELKAIRSIMSSKRFGV